MTNFYDVIVIGAGVVGNAIARELSRFESDVHYWADYLYYCAGVHILSLLKTSC